MAKLPEITYRRSVPQLQSPDAARADTKLRNISAGVQAVRGAVSTIDKALEDEARLDATRRLQDAKRDYMERAAQVTQDFHTDRDKPVEEYRAEIARVREEAFSGAMSSASGRAGKYLNPQLDAYRTQIHGAELAANEKLIESRKLMDLNDIQTSATLQASSDPTSYLEAIADVEEAWDISGLAAAEVEQGKAAFAQQATVSAISAYLDRGDPASAVEVQGTEHYKLLPNATRVSLDSAIDKAVQDSLDQERREQSNALIAGQTTLANSLRVIEAQAGQLTGLEGTEKEEFIRDAQGPLVNHYLSTQIIEGEFESVLSAINNNTYGDLLDPQDALRLKNAATRGMAAGNVSQMNAHRGALEYQAQQIEKGFNDSPGDMTTTDMEMLVALRQENIASYQEQGKEAPATAYVKFHNAQRMVADVQRIQFGMYGDRGEVRKAMFSQPVGAGPINARNMVIEGDRLRSQQLSSNPINFARREYTIPELPRAGQPGYIQGLVERLNLMPTLQGNYGSVVQNYMDEEEAQDLHDWLLTNQGTPEYRAFAAAFNDTLGPDASATILDQIIPDEQGSVVAASFRLYAMGNTTAGDMVVRGATAWEDGVEGINQRQVLAEIDEMLLGAFGTDMGSHTAYKNMIFYHAVGQTRTPGSLNPDINSDVINNAIAQTMGGMLSYRDTPIVPPTPTTTQADFTRWVGALGPETLPPLFDGLGDRIDPENFSYGLDDFMSWDRFQLEPTGRPGRFYILDMRDPQVQAGALPGAYLLNEQGTAQVLTYDPTLRRPLGPTTYTRDVPELSPSHGYYGTGE